MAPTPPERIHPSGGDFLPERKNPLPGGNEPFDCSVCGAAVKPLRNGSVRNHCPQCLWSLHVDRAPGDRSERCGGFQEPVGLEGSPSTGWTIVFRCRSCGTIRRNRASPDDPEQPDRWDLLVELSTRAPGTSKHPPGSGRDQDAR